MSRRFVYHVPYFFVRDGQGGYGSGTIECDAPLNADAIGTAKVAFAKEIGAADVVPLTPFLLGAFPDVPSSECSEVKWCQDLARVLGPVGSLSAKGLVQVGLNHNATGMQIVVAYREQKGRRGDIYLPRCPFCGTDIRNGVFLLGTAGMLLTVQGDNTLR